MEKLLALLINRRAEVLTLLLLAIGLGLTITAETPQRAKWLSSSSKVSGSIYQLKENLQDYFNLKQVNRRLSEENAQLREALYQSQFEKALIGGKFGNTDTLKQYVVSPAKVIKNSVIREKNLITLNKGAYQGIIQDMGVVSDKGVVGVVERTSDHFSTVIPLLHKDLSINAALKNTKHFGSLIWDTKTIDRCTLVDLPKISNIQIGDTIVTGGMSSVFPAGIPIGQVSAYSIPDNSSFYKAEVRLFNDMSNLDQVYVIKNTLKEEQVSLENQTNGF
ncbi:MAG: rod shape-determining protein MreC [Flavobacteriaceae bacterium]|jgi:rod shape-determining protein MreC